MRPLLERQAACRLPLLPKPFSVGGGVAQRPCPGSPGVALRRRRLAAWIDRRGSSSSCPPPCARQHSGRGEGHAQLSSAQAGTCRRFLRGPAAGGLLREGRARSRGGLLAWQCRDRRSAANPRARAGRGPREKRPPPAEWSPERAGRRLRGRRWRGAAWPGAAAEGGAQRKGAPQWTRRAGGPVPAPPPLPAPPGQAPPLPPAAISGRPARAGTGVTHQPQHRSPPPPPRRRRASSALAGCALPPPSLEPEEEEQPCPRAGGRKVGLAAPGTGTGALLRGAGAPPRGEGAGLQSPHLLARPGQGGRLCSQEGGARKGWRLCGSCPPPAASCCLFLSWGITRRGPEEVPARSPPPRSVGRAAEARRGGCQSPRAPPEARLPWEGAADLSRRSCCPPWASPFLPPDLAGEQARSSHRVPPLAARLHWRLFQETAPCLLLDASGPERCF